MGKCWGLGAELNVTEITAGVNDTAGVKGWGNWTALMLEWNDKIQQELKRSIYSATRMHLWLSVITLTRVHSARTVVKTSRHNYRNNYPHPHSWSPHCHSGLNLNLIPTWTLKVSVNPQTAVWSHGNQNGPKKTSLSGRNTYFGLQYMYNTHTHTHPLLFLILWHDWWDFWKPCMYSSMWLGAGLGGGAGLM